MAKTFSDLKAIFSKKTFANVATLMKDGSPQVTPVWVSLDEENQLVLFNTSRNNSKERNLTRDPRIAFSAQDPENPYSSIGFRGRVVEITEDGAIEHINKLAQKYLGEDKYPWLRPGEVRVIVKVKPEGFWGI
ncbi:MAG: PPOX class F420-dependent oxidoreductase [Candidatus Heimdallarchaeota archaeon]